MRTENGVLDRFFLTSNKHKINFRPELHPDPAAGAYDAPTDPLARWGGRHPLPTPFPLDDFGASISAPAAPRSWRSTYKFFPSPPRTNGNRSLAHDTRTLLKQTTKNYTITLANIITRVAHVFITKITIDFTVNSTTYLSSNKNIYNTVLIL